MSVGARHSDEELIGSLDRCHALVSCAQRELFRLIAEVDRRGAWREEGARDTAHWLCLRYGISAWKAHRWIRAAHALDSLPRLSRALCEGELGTDKVVELSRFACAKTEADLIGWAKGVSAATVRRRGELVARSSTEGVAEAERARSVSWWYEDEGRRFGLQAELPAAQGAIVARTLQRLAQVVPAMPGEEDASFASARRADALVALCSARIAADPDQDRAALVVHARLEDGSGELAEAEVDAGPPVPPQTFRRLLCNARVQIVAEDAGGNVLGLGRMSREPSAWMIRQIRYRDRGCRFPGCGTRAFTQAHHIVWWRAGGRTELDNLLLICSFHHRLVHEHGWSVSRDADGTVRWLRPDGVRYRAGPSPGVDPPVVDLSGIDPPMPDPPSPDPPVPIRR